jgi:hypothetical protein
MDFGGMGDESDLGVTPIDDEEYGFYSNFSASAAKFK